MKHFCICVHKIEILYCLLLTCIPIFVKRMVSCSLCLETIEGIPSTYQFPCGCQLTLHQQCLTELMEEGRLEYCWYCQRTLFNSQTENLPESSNTQTNTETTSVANEIPTACLLSLYFISLYIIIYKLVHVETNGLFLVGYLSFIISFIPFLAKMVQYILQNPSREQFATRIVITFFTFVLWCLFLGTNHDYLNIFVIILSFASQFYIVAIARIHYLEQRVQ